MGAHIVGFGVAQAHAQHVLGQLHRAGSVNIVKEVSVEHQQVLLQRRAVHARRETVLVEGAEPAAVVQQPELEQPMVAAQ